MTDYNYKTNELIMFLTGNAMSKIVSDFAASEGNTCVLVSAQVRYNSHRRPKLHIMASLLVQHKLY